MRSFTEGSWEWIERDEMPDQNPTPRGKYIFFSSRRASLLEIAQEEINSQNFYTCSITRNPLPRTGEYVLYLYSHDERKEATLALRHGGRQGVRYVGWKGEACTIDDFYKKMCINKEDLTI